MEKFTESIVEKATLDWLSELGYTCLHGTEIAPDTPQTERQEYHDVILINRFQNALQIINPHIPFHAIQDAIKKITCTETPILYENNRRFHKYLTDGVDVEYQQNGQTQYKKVQLIDFDKIDDDEVGFFQAIKAAMVKYTTGDGKSSEDIDAAVRQIVSKAIASEQVIDIFASVGLNKPNIAILSDEFLEEVRGLPYRNVALETLQKLINEAIKISSRKNLILARSFREMLENTIKRYQNRAIETAQVINELISLAKAIGEAQKRGENLGLTEDETAFYDALEVNDSAVIILGDDTLKAIARDLLTYSPT